MTSVVLFGGLIFERDPFELTLIRYQWVKNLETSELFLFLLLDNFEYRRFGLFQIIHFVHGLQVHDSLLFCSVVCFIHFQKEVAAFI